jgi:hypothetical protein
MVKVLERPLRFCFAAPKAGETRPFVLFAALAASSDLPTHPTRTPPRSPKSPLPQMLPPHDHSRRPTFRHRAQFFDDMTLHAFNYAAPAVGSACEVTRLGLRDYQGSQPEVVLVWRNW